MKPGIQLILHGTRQLLVYTGDVHTPIGNIHTTNKNTEALVVVTKKICLDLHAEKTELRSCLGTTRRKKQNKDEK